MSTHKLQYYRIDRAYNQRADASRQGYCIKQKLIQMVKHRLYSHHFLLLYFLVFNIITYEI